uniref:Fatty acid synthase n=1 Tax=Anopheles atroparvus TaxID=41427 RepID=A0A182IQL4_ANOAO
SNKIQKQLLDELYSEVPYEPKDISYVEAHSTGTVVGDPEECDAIDKVFCPGRTEPLLVGSVKSNIGHSEAAAGICSVTKCVIAIHNHLIPPNINFTEPRTDVPSLLNGNLKVVDKATPLGGPLVAVNSFGFGGANAHALLHASTKNKAQGNFPSDDLPRLVFWSGRTVNAVDYFLDGVGRQNFDVELYALTHNIQRKELAKMTARGYAIFAARKDGSTMLVQKNVAKAKKVVPKFTLVFGQMDYDWQETLQAFEAFPQFKATYEQCKNLLKAPEYAGIFTTGFQASTLHRAVWTLVLQISIYNVLKAIGIKVDHYGGYSIGQITCAYIDGVLSLADAIRIAFTHGALLTSYNNPETFNYREIIMDKALNTKLAIVLQSFPVAKPSEKWINATSVLSFRIYDPKCSNQLFNSIGSDEIVLQPLPSIQSTDNILKSFLGTIGRAFINGQHCNLLHLYPPVTFPVSLETPMIASLIRWDHTRDWHVSIFRTKRMIGQGSNHHTVTLAEQEYIAGHCIDGRVLIPATEYLYLVWDTLTSKTGTIMHEVAVEFTEVEFLRATTLTTGQTVTLFVEVNEASGHFEVIEGSALVVKGYVRTLENYRFLPYYPQQVLQLTDVASIIVQTILENQATIFFTVAEIHSPTKAPIISHFGDAIGDLPLVKALLTLVSNAKPEPIPNVTITEDKLMKQRNVLLLICGNLFTDDEFISDAINCLSDQGFILLRESQCYTIPEGHRRLHLVSTFFIEDEMFLLYQQKKSAMSSNVDAHVIKVSSDDHTLSWLLELKNEVKTRPVILYAQNDHASGIIGLVNCIRKEPNIQSVYCFFIDDSSAPPFDPTHPFYKDQVELGLAINVYRNGQWGLYRHFKLQEHRHLEPVTKHCYANCVKPGDLSSFTWMVGPLTERPPISPLIKIVYSSLNFKDVMLATDEITLEQAATIPTVYATVYAAFFISTDIRQGKTILIHAGTGGIGLAAIRVAQAYGLEVFTTVSTKEKREFLLSYFPELNPNNIGNSRDITFEQLIKERTNGRGVDFVLNSLSEEKLQASVRCLAKGGHFLEIGKYDMMKDSKLALSLFQKGLSFTAVLVDLMFSERRDLMMQVYKILVADIAKGIIKPLPTTVFQAQEIEQAFRYMATAKHIGKVVLKIRDNEDDLASVPISYLPRVYCNPEQTMVIAGGLGGFGLELADWLIIRGCRKVLLSSSRGITKPYQQYRINTWKSYGVQVCISTEDISTEYGCRRLLLQANQMGPVAGIFNLAVQLRDAIMENQSVDKFAECLAPKATATHHFDAITRELCPMLKYFVVFSSVSCGRGNAGQSNYGMANSIMERIIEHRVAEGLPGKAIQWGAIGEVGIVADMQEDKLDMEIGGTLQQRLSSCIQVLDQLLTTDDPIVASMVVAEKRSSSGGAKNIVEAVMNIMNIRDMKSVSVESTLADIGMDSLMAVEIRQVLERDFDIVLTPQDLRTLTFSKLQKLADAKAENEAGGVVNKQLELEDLLASFGDEAASHHTVLRLPSKSNDLEYERAVLIIPGIESVSSPPWVKIASEINAPTFVLQSFANASDEQTVSGIVDSVFDEMFQTVFAKAEQFLVIGYSFGALLALDIVKRLEARSLHGKLMLIDGSPLYLQRFASNHLSGIDDEHLQMTILTLVLSFVLPSATFDIIETIMEQSTYAKRIAKTMEMARDSNPFSEEYSRKMLRILFYRIKVAMNMAIDAREKIDSPLVLVRSGVIRDIEEDYGLKEFTTSSMIVKIIDGTHQTMLANPELIEIINKDTL